METYEDILARMETAYENESGHAAEDVSDMGLRFRVLAGELYRLRAEIAWLQRQAFPHTAVGEWLDRHGAQRGVTRREAAKAQGTLTFSRYLPLSFDVVIPKGTVCAVSGDVPVEYETVKDGVLTAGELKTEIPARAVMGGVEGNAAAGYVNTLANAISGVDYVVNKKAFTGGKERETDEEYRPRVLNAYKDLPNGTNAAYYKDTALSVEGVSSVGVKPRISGAGTVGVYIWGVDGPPDSETLEAVQAELDRKREIGVTVTVQAATARAVNVGVRVKPAAGADLDQVIAAVSQALSLYLASRSVGDAVYKTELEKAVLEAAPVIGLEFAANVRDIAGDPAYIPVAGTLSVEEIL